MRRRYLLVLGAGAVAVRASAAAAQSGKPPAIGFLHSLSPATLPPAVIAGFHAGLRDTGYVEGQNLAIEYRWAEGRYDRLRALADDLVRQEVRAIAAVGGLVSAAAAKTATSTIPIVFSMGDDPVAAGIVASFNRPGGNLTGVSFFLVELGTKLLDFATELAPGTAPIGMLANPKRLSFRPLVQAMEAAARTKGRQLLMLEAGSEGDFEAAFATLAQHRAAALVITSDPMYLGRRKQLVALAASRSIPTIYAWRDYVEAGGLMSYGPRLPDAYHTIGTYVGKILAGQRPADLPVQQPTRFELLINLKTAKTLGLTMPRSILIRADEVIE